VLPAERVWCVCSRPQYRLNLLQRRLFIGRPASLVRSGIAIPVDSGVGSVVFPAFRHLEQSQLEGERAVGPLVSCEASRSRGPDRLGKMRIKSTFMAGSQAEPKTPGETDSNGDEKGKGLNSTRMSVVRRDGPTVKEIEMPKCQRGQQHTEQCHADQDGEIKAGVNFDGRRIMILRYGLPFV
jgi:hypothetical protein